MARAPLLQLSGVGVGLAEAPLFDGIDLTLQPGDRLALVGRNGSGKSTLLRLIAGLLEPERGSRSLGPGTAVGYMEQDPDFGTHDTLGDFIEAGLPEDQHWRAAAAAEGLGIDLTAPCASASGGERRRAALARLVALPPDLVLLDEPTNHLDIAAIEWLEGWVAEARSAFVIISHDRAFLRAVTKGTLWLDRGVLRRQNAGFAAFEDWRDKIWDEEDSQRHKLDRKIKAEARWAVEGISARRKRNQGRVRALADLRAERRAQIRRQGTAALELEAAPQSGRKVIEATGVTKAYGARTIIRDLDLRVLRGDRVAIVGPNGAGKTTLVNLLTGALAPDAGSIKLGHNTELAVFDQTRAQLDPEASLWENLTGDPALGVSGRADQVMVRGNPRHVVGYLKDFLFDEAQARAPVRSLSGGEKARLLLARLMARPSNLLVLDEPTNDLDVETLDLLEEVFDGYDGTILLVSHDRDFIDRLATMTLVIEPGGAVTPYAGGWSDLLVQRGESPVALRRAEGARKRSDPVGRLAETTHAPTATSTVASGGPKPLSFTEKKRLADLPAQMEKLGAEIAKLEELLADPELYTREPVKFAKATEALQTRQTALAEAEETWLELAERAEAAGG